MLSNMPKLSNLTLFKEKGNKNTNLKVINTRSESMGVTISFDLDTDQTQRLTDKY